MVSQCTKFEVSRFTRYDAMNGGAKCRKWGSFGHLRVTQVHQQCHHSIERIRINRQLFMSNVTLTGSVCLTVFFIYCVCLFPFAKFFSFFIYVVLSHMLAK